MSKYLLVFLLLLLTSCSKIQFWKDYYVYHIPHHLLYFHEINSDAIESQAYFKFRLDSRVFDQAFSKIQLSEAMIDESMVEIDFRSKNFG